MSCCVPAGTWSNRSTIGPTRFPITGPRERVLARWFQSAYRRARRTRSGARCSSRSRRSCREPGRAWRVARADGGRSSPSIENHNDQLEFRRSGSIAYELATKQFGTEKGVDTQLATDMITLAGIYDAAIILSGDADYHLPVAREGKGKVRLLGVLPRLQRPPATGRRRRLCNAVDSRLDLNFETVRQAHWILRRPQRTLRRPRKRRTATASHRYFVSSRSTATSRRPAESRAARNMPSVLKSITISPRAPIAMMPPLPPRVGMRV